MASGSHQSNELSVLDGDDEAYLLTYLKIFEGLTVQLEYSNHSAIG